MKEATAGEAPATGDAPAEAEGDAAFDAEAVMAAAVGRGWAAVEVSPGSEGGRRSSQSANTLPQSSPNSEARKTRLEGAAFSGSRQRAQNSPPPASPAEGSSP